MLFLVQISMQIHKKGFNSTFTHGTGRTGLVCNVLDRSNGTNLFFKGKSWGAADHARSRAGFSTHWIEISWFVP